MTFSNQAVQREDPTRLLRNNLEYFGKQEISIWRETVRHDDLLFAEIYKLIFCEDPRIAWHAAWVIDHVSEVDPKKLEPHIPELIDQLPRLKSSSLRRHFTRMLSRYEIPEDQLGLLVDILYQLLAPTEAIAVRANALQVLHKIALKEPDLQAELISVIETILEEEASAGIISKGRRILQSLKINDVKRFQKRGLK